jgi:hypothetical protein
MSSQARGALRISNTSWKLRGGIKQDQARHILTCPVACETTIRQRQAHQAPADWLTEVAQCCSGSPDGLPGDSVAHRIRTRRSVQLWFDICGFRRRPIRTVSIPWYWEGIKLDLPLAGLCQLPTRSPCSEYSAHPIGAYKSPA